MKIDVKKSNVTVYKAEDYYDPTLKYLFIPQGPGTTNRISFDDVGIAKDFINAGFDSGVIAKVSIPTSVWSSTRGGHGKSAALWERGGGDPLRGGHSVLILTRLGNLVPSFCVCTIRRPAYGKNNKLLTNGKHALVTVDPRTLVVISYRDTKDEVVLVYSIDTILPALPHPNFTPEDMSATRIANMSLIAIERIDCSTGDHYSALDGNYVNADSGNVAVGNKNLIHLDRVIQLGRTKVADSALAPIGVELFYSTADADESKHCIEEGVDCLLTPVEPEYFYLSVIAQINDYRKHLSNAKSRHANAPIPLCVVHHAFEDDNGSRHILMECEIRSNDPARFKHIVVQTVMCGEIPTRIEPCFIYGARTFDSLYEQLIAKPNGRETKFLYTIA